MREVKSINSKRRILRLVIGTAPLVDSITLHPSHLAYDQGDPLISTSNTVNLNRIHETHCHDLYLI